ncbi:LytR/AlgR family response regulator transcription factor [Capnocytophaga canimorsus]|uniref:LytR/AlgR family response regulator transcription factor n=1 Tax=Capnocytophaga canimorsus TaxID=28188 RepID=UPI0037CE714A
MLRVIIADDISETLDMVGALVKEIRPDVHILGRFTSLMETQKQIELLKPDVLLIDIQFAAEAMTVFDLLDYFLRKGKLNFQTIIFSGHCETEYYDMAFRYGALHFIPKPIDKTRLKEAFQRVRNTETEEESSKTSTFHLKNKLVVYTAGLRHFIDLQNLVYIQSKKVGVSIHLSNNEIIKSSRNIGYYQEQLAGIPNFIRIHNSTLLNTDYIDTISSASERIVFLKSPFGKIQASRERFKELLENF